MDGREAFEARRRAGIRSQSEQLREDPKRAKNIDRHLAAARLEQQFMDEMAAQHVTAAELAKRVKRKASSISRDLAGGLSSAKLGRVRELADAIDCDLVPVLVPRNVEERRRVIGQIAEELTRS